MFGLRSKFGQGGSPGTSRLVELLFDFVIRGFARLVRAWLPQKSFGNCEGGGCGDLRP